MGTQASGEILGADITFGVVQAWVGHWITSLTLP
jgi:hypothetical protein